MGPAMIYAGCEFCIPVMMVGSGLIGSFGLADIMLLVIAGTMIIWVGDTLQAALGGITGRPSTVIGRCSLGTVQSRVLMSLLLFINGVGWWGLQTAVTGNAICAMFGIDYVTERWLWAAITIAAGLIFAVPSVLGYSTMKWTDYLAVPAGLAILCIGVYLSISSIGLEGIFSWSPERTMPLSMAFAVVMGPNVCQWVMISDYSRYCKPSVKDAVLMPIGVVIVGIALMSLGALMGVGGGSYDIVQVLVALGFPSLGFLLLWLAQWTTQLVNCYSSGIALCNMFNVESGKGRMKLTMLSAIVGIVVALTGIIDYFVGFLNALGVILPPIGAVMVFDYFLYRKRWEETEGWNIIATVAIALGIALAAVTSYIYPVGIPAVQGYLLAGAVYIALMKSKDVFKAKAA
jgi:cytosine permease